MKGKVTIISTLMVMSTAFTFHVEAAAQNVSPPIWVCEFLDELAAKGIVMKSSAGLFEVEAGFSREKAATLIAKAVAKMGSFNESDQKASKPKTFKQFDGREYVRSPFLSSNEEFSWEENSVVIAQEYIRLVEAVEMKRVNEFSINPTVVVLAKATVEMSRQQQVSDANEFSWQESGTVLAGSLLQADHTRQSGGIPLIDHTTFVLAKSMIHMGVNSEHNIVVNSVHTGYIQPKSIMYENYHEPTIDAQDKIILARLERELKPELVNLGFFQTQKLMKESENGTSPQIMDKDNRLKVDGEVRYSVDKNNSAASQYSYKDSQLRLRMYLDYNINDNWHAYTMLESDKSLSGKFDKNGYPTFQRAYVDGNIGLAKLTAGSFGALLGDGNIFDTQFDGINVQVPGTVQYNLLYGTSDYFNNSTILTAHYNSYDYDLDAGIHHLQLINGSVNNISDFSGNYNFEKFSLGAMYLHSSLDGENGYVFTLSNGKLKSWEAGSYNIWLKYYNQPQGTYVAHTMMGLADYMNGFKGYGLGYSTTLRENLVADFAYYKLEDYVSGNKGNTLWFDLIYTFSNKK